MAAYAPLPLDQSLESGDPPPPYTRHRKPFARLTHRPLFIHITLFCIIVVIVVGYKALGYLSPSGLRVGSKKWLQSYPDFVHGPEPLPEWIDKLNEARRLDLIPLIPQAILNMETGLAEYPSALTLDNHVCSYRRTGCIGYEDMLYLPKSRWAINFDDGPLPPSATLYRFLDAQNKHATHFWIGHNVKEHWQLAQVAVQRGDHLAVHTWSHAHLTCYSDEEIIGELGWCMKIIEDISGHRPAYFRPPYGDIDNRVRALAKHVLGLTAVMWSADSEDWTLNQTHASGDFVDPPYPDFDVQDSVARLENDMRERVSGEEGVITLEHELSEESVQAFMQTFPLLKELAWTTGAIPELDELRWYQ